MPSSTKWRLYITAVENGGFFPDLTRFEMRATIGGADLCSGGTATASSVYDAPYAASKAFDGDAGTYWLASGYAPQWIQYEFAAPQSIVEIALQSPSGYNASGVPVSFAFQYWDGAAWVTSFTVSSEPAWADLEVRTYPPPPPGLKQAWRLYVTGPTTELPGLAKLEMHTAIGGADQCTGGTASRSSEYGASYSAAKAFDADASSFWLAGDYQPQWLGYVFAAAKEIVEYSIKAPPSGYQQCTPRTFKLQYSDGSDGWVDVDTQTALAAWTAGEVRTFTAIVADVEPPTPGAVAVASATGTSLTISVGVGSDNVGVTSRTLKVYSDAGRTVQVGGDIAAVVGDNAVTGLSEATLYYVRVVYADAAGNTANGDAEGTTLRRPRTQVVTAG